MKAIPKTLISLAVTLLFESIASVQGASLDGLGVYVAGGTSSSGAIDLIAAIGQPYAGVLNGGSSTINSGFYGALAIDPSPDPQELVVNGSFENLAHTFAPDRNGVMSLPPGSTVIPGWTVVSGSLLWGGVNDNGSVLPSGAATPFGHFYVDLTGSTDTPPYAGITQAIATTPDQIYDVSFVLGTVESDGFWSGPVSVTVTVGFTTSEFSSIPTGPDWQWRKFATHFTATSTITAVTFTGNSAAGHLIALDNVSVTAVPTLRIAAFAVVGNDLLLRFPATAGHSYLIERRADMTTGAWETVTGVISTNSGDTRQLTIPDSFGEPRQFYRVKQSP